MGNKNSIFCKNPEIQSGYGEIRFRDPDKVSKADTPIIVASPQEKFDPTIEENDTFTGNDPPDAMGKIRPSPQLSTSTANIESLENVENEAYTQINYIQANENSWSNNLENEKNKNFVKLIKSESKHSLKSNNSMSEFLKLNNGGKFSIADYEFVDILINDDFFEIVKNHFQSKNYDDFTKAFLKYFFMLIKREQMLEEPLELINNELNFNIKLRLLTNKLFTLSDSELQYKIAQNLSKMNPIPVVDCGKGNVFIVKDSFWVMNREAPIVFSCGIGECKGKSKLLNEVFLTRFDTSDGSQLYQGTIDIVTDEYFKNDKRAYYVADGHGILKNEHFEFMASLSDVLIFQISASHLMTEGLDNAMKALKRTEFTSAILIVRDFDEKAHSDLKKLIGNNTFKIYFISDLTKHTYGENSGALKKQILGLSKELDEVIQVRLRNKTGYREGRQHSFKKIKEFEKYMKSISYIDDEIKRKKENLNKPGAEGDFVLVPKLYRLECYSKSTWLENSKFLELENEISLMNYNKKSPGFIFFEKMILSFDSNQTEIQNYNYLVRELKPFKENLALKTISEEIRKIKKAKSSKNASEKEVREISHQLINLDENAEKLSISVDKYWREIIRFLEKDLNYQKQNKLIEVYSKLIMKGYPFEIIDGDTFHLPYKFLDSVFNYLQFKANHRFCIISILGPQNSGKSTLLNFLFGCDFSASDGRCTRGIYGTILKSNIKEFDYFLIIDSEGLQSIEKGDPEYDRKIMLFCIAVSHLVIINVKDQITDNIKNMMIICIDVLKEVDAKKMHSPLIYFVLNQKADPNYEASEAIGALLDNLSETLTDNYISISKDTVHQLPSAFNIEVKQFGPKNSDKKWRFIKTSKDFIDSVKDLFNKIFQSITKKEQKYSQITKISEWIKFASSIYDTIKIHPDLTVFTDVIEKREDGEIKEWIKEKLNEHLKDPKFKTINDESELITLMDKKNSKFLEEYDIFINIKRLKTQKLKFSNKIYLETKINYIKIGLISDLKAKKFMEKIQEKFYSGIDIINSFIKECKNKGQIWKEQEAKIKFDELWDQEQKKLSSTEQNEIEKESFDFVYNTYVTYVERFELKQKEVSNYQLLAELESLKKKKNLLAKENQGLKNYEYSLLKKELENSSNTLFSKKIIIKILDLFYYFFKNIVSEKGIPIKQLISNRKLKHEHIRAHENNLKMFGFNYKSGYLSQVLNKCLKASDLGSAEYYPANDLEKIYEFSLKGMESLHSKEPFDNIIGPTGFSRNRAEPKSPYPDKKIVDYFIGFFFKNIGNEQLEDYFETRVTTEKFIKILENKLEGHKIDREIIQDIVVEVNQFLNIENNFFKIFGNSLQTLTKSSFHICAISVLFNTLVKNKRCELKEIEEKFIKKKNEFKENFLAQVMGLEDQATSKMLAKIVIEYFEKSLEQDRSRLFKLTMEKNKEILGRKAIQKSCDDLLLNKPSDELIKYIKYPTDVIKNEFASRWDNIKRNLDFEINEIPKKYNRIKKTLLDKMEILREELSTFEINNKNFLNDVQSNEPLLNQRFQAKGAFNFIISCFTRKEPSFKISDSLKQKKQVIDNKIYIMTNADVDFLKELFTNVGQDRLIRECCVLDFNKCINCFIQLLNEYQFNPKNIYTEHSQAIENLKKRATGCNFKCPCCKRMCDVEHWKMESVEIGTSENRHGCGLGHQFGAFVGVKIEKKNIPSLIPCEKWKDEDIVVYGGRRMSWKDFKKENSSWNFDFNLMADKEKKSLLSKFNYVWDKIGLAICEEYKIENFCSVNDFNFDELKLEATTTKPIHFIFCLDSSSSMSGQKWSDVVKASNQFIKKRALMAASSKTKDHISIITFSDKSELVLCNEEITSKTYEFKYTGGGTNFSNPLQIVKDIIDKPQKKEIDEIFMVVFLSDGEASFPHDEIETLKEKRSLIHEFWNIGFGGGDFSILKQMATEFGPNGKYFDALDASSLSDRYQELAQILPSEV